MNCPSCNKQMDSILEVCECGFVFDDDFYKQIFKDLCNQGLLDVMEMVEARKVREKMDLESCNWRF